MINTINSVMHQRGIGVLYLDNSANIIDKNNRVDEILGSTTMARKGKQLCFEDSWLRNKLTSYLSTATDSIEVASFYFKKRLDQSPVSLSVFPVEDDVIGENGEKSRWLILLNDKNIKPLFYADEMAVFYDLTKAEVALVDSIYKGLRLSQHAEKRRIKITTVRWTLDNIFSKTYTHSQSQLRELANSFTD